MCFGKNTKSNAKNIARFLMFLCLSAIIICIYGILQGANSTGVTGNGWIASVYWEVLIAMTLNFVVNSLLYLGVQQESVCKLEVWLVLQYIGLVWIVLDIFWCLTKGVDLICASNLIGIAFEIYFISVVRKFLKELKEGVVFPRDGGGLVRARAENQDQGNQERFNVQIDNNVGIHSI